MKLYQKEQSIIIKVEYENERIFGITYELLHIGRVLAEKANASLNAVVFGSDINSIADEVSQYVDKIYIIKNTLWESHQTDAYAFALENLFRQVVPSVILFEHNYDNLDLAPKLACRLNTDIVTDCTFLDSDKESRSLLCTKPVYGGNANAVFEISKEPQIVTIRPKSFETINPEFKKEINGEVIHYDLKIERSLLRIESMKEVFIKGVSLDKADVIVSGGRGLRITRD